MTVILNIPVTGRAKRDIVELAHELCGQAGYEFELTPEEAGSALRVLDLLMTEHPFNLMGYAPGATEELSGLAEIDVTPAYTQLALRIAAGKGKLLSPSAQGQIAAAYASACARYATVPTMPLAPNTPRGAGARGFAGPFINESA